MSTNTAPRPEHTCARPVETRPSFCPACDRERELVSDRHPTVDLPAHMEGPRVPTSWQPSTGATR